MGPVEVMMVLSCCGLVGGTFHTDENRLRTFLLTSRDYNYKIRPAQTVSVSASFSLLSINQLDIKTQTLAITGWFKMTWLDPRLVWEPSSYGDIKDIFDTELVIWRPEVLVDNSISNVGIIEDDKLLLRVSNNGTVTWEPPGVFVTHCDVDISYYPFDTQSCVVELTTWGYSTDEVSSEVASDAISLSEFQDNGEWDVVETRSQGRTLADGGESRSQLDFVIKVRRKAFFYVLNIIVPVVVMSLLSVLVFLVPVESGEKVTYALTVLLSYAVLMTIVSDNMPATSKNASVLSIYLTFILLISALSTLLSVLVLYLHHQPAFLPGSGRRGALTNFTVGCLARVAGLELPDKEIDDSSSRWTASGRLSAKIVPIAEISEEDVTSRTEDQRNEDLKKIEKKVNGEGFAGAQIAVIVNVTCYRVFLSVVLICTVLFLLVLLAGGYYA